MTPTLNPVSIVEENLRSAMRFFGEATGNGEVRDDPGIVIINCGRDYGVFNIALLTAPAHDETELVERIEAAARYFRARAYRWSLWLCEDLIDTAARRRARQIFTRFGMRPISAPPGMLAEQLRNPGRPLPAIECVPVKDVVMREAFAEITAATFEIPLAIAREVYTPEQAWHGAYQGFVGIVNGRPQAIVAIAATAGALGVYSLGTRPESRRKGYGEALMRAALQMSRGRTATDRTILQSTEAGYSLYRRMGFRDVTRFTVYLTK
jgi:GNAT superfamily N-acetyltransferase